MSAGRAAVVDLRSDTVTRPGAAMRAAIARAEVGDDAFGDDPTAQRLEQRIAELLGKEAALFFPSGIMANETALAVQCAPGTEVICEATSHFTDWEAGAPAFIARVQLRGVAAPGGMLTAELVERAIRPTTATWQLQTSLIALENTHNAAGGCVLPPDVMRSICAVAHTYGLPVHLDGARLWNAAAALGVSEAELAGGADTVMVTLSKALGCPVGSVLAGSAETMKRARIMRRRLGGGMRQVGVLAAAGLFALDHHRARLHEDHARARTLAAGVRELRGVRVSEPETNIVMIDLTDPQLTAGTVLAQLEEHAVLMTAFTPARIRAVTHLDIDDEGIDRAVSALAHVLG